MIRGKGLVITGCILTLLTGCGAEASSMPPVATEPSEGIQTDVKNESGSCITIARAKAVVLENADISEENVRFVRVHLDTDDAGSKYDIEFISEDAQYDYVVNAVTGEIISMNCENREYNIATVPAEVTQAVDAQSMELQNHVVQTGNTQSGSAGTQAAGGTRNAETHSTDTQTGADAQYIGVEAAKQAALDHAGLSAGEVRFVHAHLEFDDGRWQYDVEFHKGTTEYDYDIDALTGAVLSYDADAEYFQHAGDNINDITEREVITQERAKQLALEYAGLSEADVLHLKCEFDYDDGRSEYEIEWKVGNMEYSCDVDAHTGAILSFEKELD